MKKLSLFLILLLVTLSITFATSLDARIIDAKSSLYDDMDTLYLLLGLSRPYTTRPWSEGEARMIFDKVKDMAVTKEEVFLKERIEKVIEEGLRFKPSKNFQFDTSLELNPELYTHSNDKTYTTENDWNLGYFDRKPVIRINLEFTSFNNFYTSCDITYNYSRAGLKDTYKDYYGSDRETKDHYVGSFKITDPRTGGGNYAYFVEKSEWFSNKFSTNVPLNFYNFSFIFPQRAIFSFGGKNWNVNISRDKLSLGDSPFSNLLVDGRMFSDYLRASFFNESFKYDFVMMFLETMNGVSEAGNVEDNEGRMYLIHTLQFRLWDRVTFILSENVVHKYSIMQPFYFNPAFIYHNLNNRRMFNALAYAEVNILLSPGLELYNQFAMDQARAPFEGDNQADSYGIILGLKGTIPLKRGLLTLIVEGDYTAPLLYRRDGVDFIRMNTYYRYPAGGYIPGATGHIPFFGYIGYEYGSDAIVFRLSSKYEDFSLWNVETCFTYIEKGEVGLFSSHNKDGNNDGDANISGSTPTGNNILNVFILSLKGEYDFSLLFKYPTMKAYAELDYVSRWYFEESSKTQSKSDGDLQFTFGVSIGI